jgi:hypothetical protein
MSGPGPDYEADAKRIRLLIHVADSFGSSRPTVRRELHAYK